MSNLKAVKIGASFGTVCKKIGKWQSQCLFSIRFVGKSPLITA